MEILMSWLLIGGACCVIIAVVASYHVGRIKQLEKTAKCFKAGLALMEVILDYEDAIKRWWFAEGRTASVPELEQALHELMERTKQARARKKAARGQVLDDFGWIKDGAGNSHWAGPGSPPGDE